MGSDTDHDDPSGPVWLDNHCNLWFRDEVGKVCGDDKVRKAGGESGEGGEVSGDDGGGEGGESASPSTLAPRCKAETNRTRCRISDSCNVVSLAAPLWFAVHRLCLEKPWKVVETLLCSMSMSM